MPSQARLGRRILMLTVVFVLLSSSITHAQWVFVGRKAMKVITAIAGELQSQGQGHAVDAATVLLEAEADKVYAAVVRFLQESPNARILSQDASKRTIAFARGDQSASMKVSRLDDRLAQILVAGPAGKPGGTSFVVDGIMRVCQQMGVECSRASDH
jgi:hypothetical protein